MSWSDWKALPDDREWSGGCPGCPGVVGSPSRVVGRPSRVVGMPSRCPGVVERPSRTTVSGREATRMSGSGWEALPDVWE